MEDDRDPPQEELHEEGDTWEPSEDGRTWTRIHQNPRRRLYVPSFTENVPVHLFAPGRITIVRRGGPTPDRLRIQDEWQHPSSNRELHYLWTGSTTFVIDRDRSSPTSYQSIEDPSGDPDAGEADDEHMSGDPPFSSGRTTTSPTPGDVQPSRSSHSSSADPSAAIAEAQATETPPSPPGSSRPEPQAEPEETGPRERSDPLFQPPHEETFEEKRTRFAQQETISIQPPIVYGPQRDAPQRPTPYVRRAIEDDETEKALHATFDIELIKQQGLPLLKPTP